VLYSSRVRPNFTVLNRLLAGERICGVEWSKNEEPVPKPGRFEIRDAVLRAALLKTKLI